MTTIGTFARVIFTAILLFGARAPARAVAPDEILKDPALEARARQISADLRCLVCQNQSIDDSNAPLARDLRLLVRERLQNGDTNRQVLAYIVARYGEFVLLRPVFAPHTIILWLTPVAILMIVGFFIIARARRPTRPATEPLPLDAAEQARLRQLLDKS